MWLIITCPLLFQGGRYRVAAAAGSSCAALQGWAKRALVVEKSHGKSPWARVPSMACGERNVLQTPRLGVDGEKKRAIPAWMLPWPALFCV